MTTPAKKIDDKINKIQSNINFNWVLQLVKKEPLYPKICTCILGEFNTEDYKNVIELLLFKTLTKKDIKDIGFSFIDPLKISLHSYGGKEFDKKKKIGYEISIEISDEKKNYKKSIEYLTKLGEITKDIEKNKIIKTITETHKKALSENIPKENKCHFRLDIKLFVYKDMSKESLEKGTFIKEYEMVNKILSVFTKFNIKIHGKTCNELAFDTKNYCLIGEIKLPFDILSIPEVKSIPLVGQLIEKVGKPEIIGISLQIKKSPIGLEYITIMSKKNKYIMPIKFNYITDKIEDILRRNYVQSLEISKIFIREIK